MSNLKIWEQFSKPPTTALKPITAGRLKGKSDINPQWRYQAMTEVFGPIGFGWKYTVDRKWTEMGSDNQVMCFADVSLYVKLNGEWSDAIPGSGGAMLVEMESRGLHTSDEGYKMAITDALSVAMKMLGVAAEVYLGNFDGSKYLPKNQNDRPKDNTPSTGTATKDDEYKDRIKKALHTLFGTDKAAALDKVEALTSFIPSGKTEADRVKGVRDYTKLSGKRLEILAHSLERESK